MESWMCAGPQCPDLPETDTWFWNPTYRCKPAEKLYEMYKGAVVDGKANLLLNVAPDDTGRIPEETVTELMKMKDLIDKGNPDR